jgi:acyl carrier protein
MKSKDLKDLAVSEKESEIQAWLIAQIAEIIEIEPDQIDITVPFENYGLDSEAAVVLSGDLQEYLGIDLEPTIFFDYPTIEAMAQSLVGDV